MLAVQSERKHLRRFKTHRFQASTRNKHRTRQQSSVDSLSTGLRTMVIYGCKNYPFFVLHFAFCVLTAAFYFNWCVLTSQLCGVIGYTFTGTRCLWFVWLPCYKYLYITHTQPTEAAVRLINCSLRVSLVFLPVALKSGHWLPWWTPVKVRRRCKRISSLRWDASCGELRLHGLLLKVAQCTGFPSCVTKRGYVESKILESSCRI